MPRRILNSIINNNGAATWTVIGAICSIYILRTNSVIYFEGGDNAHYLLLAKALATGKGYRDVFLAGSPAHTQYPPLFPALLALVYRVSGMNLYVMNMLVSFGAAASLLLTFVLLKRRSFSWPAVPIIWIACSFKFFSQTDWLLSETVYMALAAAAILFADSWLKDGGWKFLDSRLRVPHLDRSEARTRWDTLNVQNLPGTHLVLAPRAAVKVGYPDSSTGNQGWKYAMLGLAACWAAELTRTAGIALALSIGCAVFLKGKSRRSAASALLATALCLIPLVAWTLRNFVSRDVPTDYLSQFFRADPYDASKGPVNLYWFAIRIFENAESHGWDLANLLNGNVGKLPLAVAIPAGVLLFALMALGYYKRVRDGTGLIEIYTLFYFAMIMAWPFEGYRFMMPIYPFLLTYIVEGAQFLIVIKTKERPSLRRPLLYIFIALFFFSLVTNVISSVKYESSIVGKISRKEFIVVEGARLMPLSENHARLLQACKWLSKQTQPDAIVMTRLSRLVALASDRTVIACPQVAHPDPGAWLKLKGVRFIIVDEVYPDATDFMLALAASRVEIPGLVTRFQSGDTVVVEVMSEFYSP